MCMGGRGDGCGFTQSAAATADASLPVLTQMSPAETSTSDSLLPRDEDPLLQCTTLSSCGLENESFGPPGG